MAKKDEVIQAFQDEFGFLVDRIEIMDLLANNSPMDYRTIEYLKLPSPEYNIVWHPGVYVFIGNNHVYRVGVSVRNSRHRVMQHIAVGTGRGGNSVLDIARYPDASIVLFNVKRPEEDRHWLLALEVYLERKFNPLIRSKRIG